MRNEPDFVSLILVEVSRHVNCRKIKFEMIFQDEKKCSYKEKSIIPTKMQRTLLNCPDIGKTVHTFFLKLTLHWIFFKEGEKA